MMRKAVAANILLLLLLLLGTYQIYYTAMIGVSGVRISVKRYQEDIYGMQNSLDAGKQFIRTSLSFSAYQSCHDIFGNGGWGETTDIPDNMKIDHEGKTYIHLAPEDQFKSWLENDMLENLNTYTYSNYGFLGVYSVILPSYESLEIKGHDGQGLTIEADSQDKLEITRYVRELDLGEGYYLLEERLKDEEVREQIILWKNPGLNEVISTECYGLYEESKNSINEEKEILSNAVKNELEKKSGDEYVWPGTISGFSGTNTKEVTTQEEAFILALNRDISTVTIDDITSEISNNIKSGLGSLSNEIISGPEVRISVSDCTYTNVPGGNTFDVEISGCNIEYTVKTSIKKEMESSEEYPVWNGNEISLEKIHARFFMQNNILKKSDNSFEEIETIIDTGPGQTDLSGKYELKITIVQPEKNKGTYSINVDIEQNGNELIGTANYNGKTYPATGYIQGSSISMGMDSVQMGDASVNIRINGIVGKGGAEITGKLSGRGYKGIFSKAISGDFQAQRLS